jgi:hypothetical protein
MDAGLLVAKLVLARLTSKLEATSDEVTEWCDLNHQ